MVCTVTHRRHAARRSNYGFRQTRRNRGAGIPAAPHRPSATENAVTAAHLLHRNDRRAFEADALALGLAQEAVAAQADLALAQEERLFLYMPYMHSESRLIHEVAERLFREHAPSSNHEYELRHKAIIDRFGRYPHRNAVLGRESTAEETAFLQEPGSRF